jgi:hypothetical protein
MQRILPETAAQLFLTWLRDPTQHHNRPWLIVWDDLTDPSTVQDLWPPHDQHHGRMLVTTRRRDHTLTIQGRHLLDVGVYTPSEAQAFLTHALTKSRVSHTSEQLSVLAHDLGYLPLALSQAVTYITELRIDFTSYLEIFHDRMHTLHDVFPDWENPTPLAATWELSVKQADMFHPKGVARPMMGLISLLDGSNIPESLLTSKSVLSYLSAHRADGFSTESELPKLSPYQAQAALAGLYRGGLLPVGRAARPASTPALRTLGT